MPIVKDLPPDQRDRRPKNSEQRRALVKLTFRRNAWGSSEISVYLRSLEIEDKPIYLFTNAELDRVLEDFEKSKMILF